MASPTLHKRLLTILREKLIPAARRGAPLELLEPPLRGIAGKVTSQRARPLPLSRVEPSHIHLRTWREQGLNTLRVPYLGFVFEGEADIKTGVVSTSRRASQALLNTGRQVLTAEAGTFFLVPPGVPVSSGPRPHWEREHPEKAYSRLFWINILPSGAMCHTCSSVKGEHNTHPFLFVREPELALSTELLLRELRRHETDQAAQVREAAITGAQLLILLLQLERAFAAHEPMLLDSARQMERVAALPGSTQSLKLNPAEPEVPDVLFTDTAVQRACSFIQANLNTTLTPAVIAANVFVSTAHLNRLFHAKCGVPVMRYVAQYRHESAKSLLADSALPVGEVGSFVGYCHASHFSQVFTRFEGITPQEYRRRSRSAPRKAKSPPRVKS